MDRDTLERRIGPRSFARLLGSWRPVGGRGLAAALTERVRLLVLDGRLPLDTRVPAERELATALDVSRTTVAAAYDTLRAAGFLHSRRGAGSWTRIPSGPPGGADTPTPFSPVTDESLFDLATAAMPSPSDVLRRAAAGALTDLDAHLGGHGYTLTGLPVLRAAIARRFTDRGLPTAPEQILVTSGAQHAIALLLALFTGPGERVVVEHPTYPNALDAIRGRGCRPVPVALGPDPGRAWDLDQLTATVRDTAPALAYLIPEFQNPTGAVMGTDARAGVVDLARRTRTPLIVDETLAELPLDVEAALPVAAHGAQDGSSVITVGSASKVFWGGLRIGWIRSSPTVVRRLAALRPSLDLGGAVLDQLVAARLVGEVEAAAAERRETLRTQRDDLRARLAETFPEWQVPCPVGGMSLWVDLGSPVSSLLAGAARRQDVLLAAGPRFGVDGAFERRLRLPYTLRPDRVASAVERLALAWRTLGSAPHGGESDRIAVA
ncbi:MAG: PLP-dependent aminotransferase family protein [Pseudonocardia sp.]|nr:PLP-dependent aminotransferase family protein [Pseudonocardia sp.]